MKITISAIKADVGSIGGHTRPLEAMLEAARARMDLAIECGQIIDAMVTFTGDDIALTMTHTKGNDHPEIHQLAWDTFLAATEIAKQYGCYGAGQDLLVDAPSGNVRGAGPGVAEITFDHVLEKPRAAESFMVVTADKCGPGAFNLMLFSAFADPMFCAGLMLPGMIQGFTFEIIDMDNTTRQEASKIVLHAPEDYYKIAFLLRDNNRFGISAIYSRRYPDAQAVSASTDRLHNIAGTYAGKDDPIAIIRNQGIFPAPEEIVAPLAKAYYTGGGARGSHNMPLVPMPMNSAVTGVYCMPIISCVGYSLAPDGTFARAQVDFLDNPVWDAVRLKAQHKAFELRENGWSGPAMLPYSELEYGGYRETLADLLAQFSR